MSFNTIVENTIDDNGVLVNQNKYSKFYPFKDGVGYKFRRNSSFVKTYANVDLPSCFSDSESWKIFTLSKHMYSKTNLLAMNSTDRTLGDKNCVKPMSKEKMMELLKTSKSRFYPLLKKIIKNKVAKYITLEGEEFLCINPIYFNTTIYLPFYVYFAFQDELNKELPKYVIEKYNDMK